MQLTKDQQSYVLDAVIGILTIAFLIALFLPRSLWRSEDERRSECRQLMHQIFEVEKEFFRLTDSYLPLSVLAAGADTSKGRSDRVSLDEAALREVIAVVATVHDSLIQDTLFSGDREIRVDTTSYAVTVIGKAAARHDSLFATSLRDMSILCPLSGEPIRVEIESTYSLELHCPIERSYRERRFLIYAVSDTSHGNIIDGDHSWIRGDE